MKNRVTLTLVLLILVILFSGCSDEQSEQVITPKTWSEIQNIIDGMPENERPQIITITFDDGHDEVADGYVSKIFNGTHKNPNGAPIPATFYISNEYTDYHLVQQKYARGHEIAVHTITHTTGVPDSYDKWRGEIVGSRNALTSLARIPKEDVVGFRAPFLAHSDASFRVLWEEGFLYESSVTEQVGNNSPDIRNFIFPYTFDSLGTQTYAVGEGPSQTYPGLWEIPMWGWHNEHGQLIANMDPTGSAGDLLTMFNETFDVRYASNRAPIGIFLHPGWLSQDYRADAVNAFLTRSLAKEGVWVMTSRQIIEWMKDPKTISEMMTWSGVQYTEPAAGEEVPDGWDNDGDGEIDEGFVKNCKYGQYSFNTTADECPAEYPSVNLVTTVKFSTSVRGDLIGMTECEDPAWVKGKTYNGGEKVSYNGRAYFAQWYTQETPGTSEWGSWIDKGECEFEEYAYNGTVFPSNDFRVPENVDTVVVVTPNPGYQIKDVIVDGESIGVYDSIFFDNVTENHTVEALFEIETNFVTFDVTASANAGGFINPEAVTPVREGETQDYTIVPDPGFRIKDVLVDGVSVGIVEAYTFPPVTEVHTIEAIFEAIPTFTVSAAAGTNGTIAPVGDTVVEEGTDLLYTITPDVGYRILEVTVDGVKKGNILEVPFTTINENHTVDVTFEMIPLVYNNVTFTTTDGGSITGDTKVLQTTDATYAITADKGFRIVDVKLDGVSQGKVSELTIPAIDADHSIEAVFELIPTFTVSATAGANGTISPVGDTVIEEGKDLLYIITPDAGYQILDVTLDGVSQGAVESLPVTAIAKDYTVAATFELIPVIYDTVFLTASAGGSITPNGVNGEFEMIRGESQTFTIAADAGYELTSLKVNGTAVALSNSVEVNAIDANTTIEATFAEIIFYNVTVQVVGNGSISTDATFSVREGSDTVITFTPDVGYEIGTVVLNGADQGKTAEITLTNISGDQSVAVSFEEKTGSICDGVETWNEDQNWTSYTVGDLRVNKGAVYECTVIHYTYYEPSSAWGHLGWKKVADCQ